MSYEPLHHKYRPQTFADLVGQETIALTLTHAIEQNKIAPAYLFTGPRGTGKTSSARILAKSLNCLTSQQPTVNPCGRCEICLAISTGNALDIMEIDAASNTGVDNIREIIERSRFAPVQCRYKIYVIDECHMLSAAAFNALLKTLEEPPPHVIFILATTDPQRVLSTIISRCQRFDYRRIPLEVTISHLQLIAEREGIDITKEAIRLVAQIANGGLRDAESLLDQLSLLPDRITVEIVWDLVGAIPEKDLLELLIAIKNNYYETVIEKCRYLLDRGLEPLVLLQNLADFYLNLLIAKTAPSRPDMVTITELCWQELCREAKDCSLDWILKGQQKLQTAEIQLKNTTQARLWLEITLLSLLSSDKTTDLEQPLEGIIGRVSPVSPQRVSHALFSNLEIDPKPMQLAENNTHQEIIASKDERETVMRKIEQKLDSSVISPLVSTTTSEKNLDRDTIWRQVIASIHPPTTQALLSQQCHLIDIEQTEAIVGISSTKLRGLSQGKIPNIEAAFEKVCHRKIKVRLEVVSKKANLITDRIKVDIDIEPADNELLETNNNTEIQIAPKSQEFLEKSEPKNTFDKFPSNLSPNEITSAVNFKDRQCDINKTTENLQQVVVNIAKNFEGEIVNLEQIYTNIPSGATIISN
jgi:DNA polymerase-3 subunit gamma/tau